MRVRINPDAADRPKKRRVCMFVYNNFKYDSRVLREAKTLAEVGYDVRVIAVLDKTTEPYEVQDGFRVIRVLKNPLHYMLLRVIRVILFAVCRILNILSRFAVILIHKPSEDRSTTPKYKRLMEKLKQAFYSKVKGFLMIFHKPLSFLDYYYRALRVIEKEPADIYHAHDLNTLLAAYWAKKKMGGKLIYDSHELYTERNTLKNQSKLTKFLISKTESFLVKSADHVITVSDSIGQELRKRYLIKRLTVIINTPSYRVSKHVLSLHEELRIPEVNKIILYVGNIAFNRGLEELIQSLLYLENCALVIMGYSSNHAYITKLRLLTRDLGVGDKVYFFGPVPSEKVTEYVASADVGAAPIKNVCLSYYYCSPNKLFEYITGGIPAVVSNFPELKKTIEGYKLGMTFNPDDPKDMAEAINYVLSDKDRYEEMKRNALKAARVFNWENESKKLLQIYRRLEDEINITSN